MLKQFTADNFIAGRYDQLHGLGLQHSEVGIDHGGSLLQDGHTLHHFAWHPLFADGEVDQRAGCLCPVVGG